VKYVIIRTNVYPSVERDNVKVKCLAQEDSVMALANKA